MSVPLEVSYDNLDYEKWGFCLKREGSFNWSNTLFIAYQMKEMQTMRGKIRGKMRTEKNMCLLGRRLLLIPGQ